MVQEKGVMMWKKVLYIGCAVPTDTADGLDGVQKPLLDRYPVDDDTKIEGILSIISVLPNGITLQYVSDPNNVLFFPISSLSLCAAVRCVTTVNDSTGQKSARFVSLSSPAAGGANSNRPAIFTTITRRTEGKKVLECSGFVCFSSRDALEMVQYTSFADRLSKGKINGMGPPGGPLPHPHPHPHPHPETASLPPRGLESYTLKSSSTVGLATAGAASASASGPASVDGGDHPVRMVSGDSVSQRVAPEFYEPPPQHGYFYTTQDSQIKTYTVERVMEGDAERLRAISPHAGAATAFTLPRAGPPSGDRRSLYGGAPSLPPPPPPMTLPYPQGYPQGRTLIPVRAVPPPGTLIRPRFFSPPPAMVRPRPGPVPPGHVMMRGGDPYVFLPPPPAHLDAPYVVRGRPPRRAGSGSSSRRSSGSSSPGSPREVNGKAVNGEGADGSSDVSSRPHTPPTDYEKGGRVSRKEQFDRSQQRYLREVNGGPGHYATLPHPGGPLPPPHLHPSQLVHPYDMYVYPRYAGYPPYMMERAKSVPPPAHRGKSQDGKKNRKTKKDKKKKSGKKRTHGVPSDVSTDSMGYTSEMGPGGEYPRMPRDFRRFENQFKHERAFSKSLAQESRGDGAENPANVYSLNEHMSQRAAGADADFNLY